MVSVTSMCFMLVLSFNVSEWFSRVGLKFVFFSNFLEQFLEIIIIKSNTIIENIGTIHTW